MRKTIYSVLCIALKAKLPSFRAGVILMQPGLSEKSLRILATTSLFLLLLVCAACGGSSSSSTAASGALTGNWQINLFQEYPGKPAQYPVTGFLEESSGSALTGSLNVAVPTSVNNSTCEGEGVVSGTVSGQSVTFAINQGGAVLNFEGAIASGTMSGSYQESGACFGKEPATGTWTATMIPALNGSFTGNLVDSRYMSDLEYPNPPNPVPVSGTFTQTSNVGSSQASVSGTINAVGYPCFTTASLVGTISGQNLLLQIYGDTGQQIGTMGTSTDPVVVASSSGGISLTGDENSLQVLFVSTALGTSGPCPAISGNLTYDNAAVQLQLTSQ